MGRATITKNVQRAVSVISIHALRGEGDKTYHLFCIILGDFNPRPPWGGRPQPSGFPSLSRSFQSTPSVGRATFKIGREIGKYIGISIHALRGEGDAYSGGTLNVPVYISIHALRGEGDPRAPRAGALRLYFNPRPPWGGRLISKWKSDGVGVFQSTPSVGRATCQMRAIVEGLVISIHALRGEGD